LFEAAYKIARFQN